jgi:hypothetical protein
MVKDVPGLGSRVVTMENDAENVPKSGRNKADKGSSESN